MPLGLTGGGADPKAAWADNIAPKGASVAYAAPLYGSAAPNVVAQVGSNSASAPAVIRALGVVTNPRGPTSPVKVSLGGYAEVSNVDAPTGSITWWLRVTDSLGRTLDTATTNKAVNNYNGVSLAMVEGILQGDLTLALVGYGDNAVRQVGSQNVRGLLLALG